MKNVATDKSLINKVYSEIYRGMEISGFITRFGDFEVFVVNGGHPNINGAINVPYQGNNIIRAREWIDKNYSK